MDLCNIQLRDLQLEPHPTLTFSYLLNDEAPSFFETVAKDAANGRRALAENMGLKLQLEELEGSTKKKKKKKKKKKSQRPLTPGEVSSIGDMKLQLDRIRQKLQELKGILQDQDSQLNTMHSSLQALEKART
ncbi:hypothetical protein H0H92_008134 [Tricholoma furcatifolium]|nr:hypothetical protein H0H92_008134 [Tricholoma furcatifolium]